MIYLSFYLSIYHSHLANISAGRTNQSALVQPTILHDSYNNLLSSMVTRIGIITDLKNETESSLEIRSYLIIASPQVSQTHYNMQSANFALVQVATGAPMLPLSRLFASSLLPHIVGMVETSRVRPVLL